MGASGQGPTAGAHVDADPPADPTRARSGVTRLVAPITALIRRGSASASEPEPQPQQIREASVLIVDDDADVRLTLRTVLRRSPHLRVVGEAADGEEAIAFVRGRAPDIVLLDLMMPNLDGRDAAPVIFREAPETMIVVLSALSAADEAEEALASGAFAYVEKSELGPRLAEGLERLWTRFRLALDGEDVWAPSGSRRPPT